MQAPSPQERGKAAGRTQVLALPFSNSGPLIILKATWPGGRWWLRYRGAQQVNNIPALCREHASWGRQGQSLRIASPPFLELSTPALKRKHIQHTTEVIWRL